MLSGEKQERTERLLDRRTPYVRWSFYLLWVCLVLLAALAAGVGYLGFMSSRAPVRTSLHGITGEQRRDLAGKLLSAGLPDKAIEQYELYLEESAIPADRKANIAFTIGKLHMEQGRYEDALSWLYRVEMLDPATQLGPEVGSKIVACLERLGRYAQAQFSLDARSNLDRAKTDESKGDQVVARIGQDAVTLQELLGAIDALPDWMRASLEDPGRKEAFLNQYVAEELLYRKARKLELDKDPRIRKQSEMALRQLLVKKVLEEEIRDKAKISAEDVALYFKANQDRYQEKEAYKIRFMRVGENQLNEVMAALRKGADFASLARSRSLDEATRDKGGEIQEWIERGLDPTGIGDPERLWQTLSALGKPGIAEPVKTPQGDCVFQIVSRRPERLPSLEEAKQRVEQDLYQERIEKAYKGLVEQALQASDVKVFPEVLRGAQAGEKTESKSSGSTGRSEDTTESPSNPGSESSSEDAP